ncbi:FecR family protein [Pedobacter sp. MC2016-24]|uniref:FecR family protein n=1 Tax=Pedobacter sp. MC2016-24 TaxID=2780090 RepID=UPI0018805059|nr:FecR family protein [Pedobacter sp. MC2016-24]MBE9600291.1 FecR domain-containing protein [Pedobacter sp. MC2016-24]
MEASENHHIHISALISRYLLNELDGAELTELEDWIVADEQHARLFRNLLNEAELENQGRIFRTADTEAALLRAKAKLSLITTAGSSTEADLKPKKLWKYGWVAAAVATLIFGLWFFESHYRNGRHPELVSGSAYANDIAPGKNTATLTLASGKTITLSEAKTGVIINASKISYNDGTDLSAYGGDAEGADGNHQIFTAQTPRGGTYQVTLPDGTHVWLNADSKISFPAKFSGASRKILLSGEAYFEVSHMSKAVPKPFIVETARQQVTVLGTHFNISAYSDERDTKTTLLEGSVKVSTSQGAPATILRPNQQATTSGTTITTREVDPSLAIAWKTGRFTYKDTPLETVMRQISRWYDVDITYTSSDLKNELFSGSVSRYDHVSRILGTIEFTGTVKFKLQGKQITVTK